MDANGTNTNAIREAREAKGMGSIELAFRIRRSQTTVWRYENGEAQPSLATAKRIAEVLDCSLNDLFPTSTETSTQEAA